MADTMKDLVNATFDQTDIVNNDTITIYTTDSSKSAVIKDIDFKDVNFETKNGSVLVNGFEELEGLEKASGTSIVPSSSSVDIKLDPAVTALVVKGPFFYQNQTYGYGTVQQTTGDIVSTSPYEYTGNTELTTSTRNTNPGEKSWFIEMEDPATSTYDYAGVYYDGNSISELYVYTGTVADGLSNYYVSGENYEFKAWNYDDHTVMWKENSNNTVVSEYSPVTNSTTTRTPTSTSTASTPSTYTKSAYCNGYFFHQISSSYRSKIEVMDLSTNEWMQKSASGTGNDFYMEGGGALVVTYNETEDKYYIFTYYAGNGRLHSLSCTDGVISASDTITYHWQKSQSSGNFTGNATAIVLADNVFSLPTYSSQNYTLRSFSNNEMIIEHTFTDFGASYAANTIAGKAGTNPIANADASDFNVSVSCRMTGIESN